MSRQRGRRYREPSPESEPEPEYRDMHVVIQGNRFLGHGGATSIVDGQRVGRDLKVQIRNNRFEAPTTYDDDESPPKSHGCQRSRAAPPISSRYEDDDDDEVASNMRRMSLSNNSPSSSSRRPRRKPITKDLNLFIADNTIGRFKWND